MYVCMLCYVRGVESTIKAEPNEELKLQLRKKEEQLREEKHQLREKEIVVLKMEVQAKEDEEDGDRLALEEEGAQPPRSKKQRIESSFDFPPSQATWKKMVTSNKLPDFEDFLQSIHLCHEELQLDETNDIHVAQVNKCITENSLPMNEGYPLLVCGNMIAYFTAKLNSSAGKQAYRFSITPVVYDVPTDHRQADYVIVKILNRRTIAVIELKLDVSLGISAKSKDHIAQLIYEAYCVCKQEGTDYENLLCIYANHESWHFFLMDMSKIRKVCKSYFKSGKELTTETLCKIMEHYMQYF